MTKINPEPVPGGNTVKEFYLGKTRVLICGDAYQNRTPEDMEHTRRSIGLIALEALRGKAAREEGREAQAPR